MGTFIVISYAFCIYGLGMLLESIILIRKSMKVSNWPITVGTIKDLSIQTDEIHSSVTSINHQVIVSYDYFVFGEMHIGSRIAFGYYGGENFAPQQAILKKLIHTPKILVRYDPNSPEISTLSFGIHNNIKRKIVNSFMVLSFMLVFPLLELSGGLSLYGIILFICCFIIVGIVERRIDNTIIKNICNYN